MSVCVCILIYGRPWYLRAGRRAVASVLARSDFDVFVAIDPRHRWRTSHSRVTVEALAPSDEAAGRAAPFLLKFTALDRCLAHTRAERLILLDADAMFAASIRPCAVERALDGRGLGMVEQSAIAGSAMSRRDLRAHYVNHTLVWFGAPTAPAPDRFRYFNSGVVLGARAELARVTRWALDRIRRPAEHRVGGHMIADQDYLQYWTNSLYPESCTPLSWHWNHSDRWDAGFPRPGARVLHFSNFCRGPSFWQVARMQAHLLRSAADDPADR